MSFRLRLRRYQLQGSSSRENMFITISWVPKADLDPLQAEGTRRCRKPEGPEKPISFFFGSETTAPQTPRSSGLCQRIGRATAIQNAAKRLGKFSFDSTSIELRRNVPVRPAAPTKRRGRRTGRNLPRRQRTSQLQTFANNLRSCGRFQVAVAG
jgi:hypothetical protein